jgi:hypothetical protein
METSLYENKENMLRLVKEKQKVEANLRVKGLAIEKVKMYQTDVRR